MRRRTFIAGLFGASTMTAVHAGERPRIAVLHSGYPERTPIHLLFEALQKLGHENGRTATIELLGGEGNADRINAHVVRLAAQKPAVIIAITSPAVLSLKRAGLKTPVVFAFVPDPIGLGIVESYAHPGGGFTGVTYSEAALGGKRLELLLDALPPTRRVAFFWSRQLSESVAFLDSIRSAAAPRGMEVFSREIVGIEDLAPAFADAPRAGAQAAIIMPDNLLFGHRKRVAELALAHRLPTMHTFATEVRDGGLMSYGPSMAENYRRAAALADRVLRGARPSELPVEQPTTFELVVNLKTAQALGLAVPDSLLARADEVIE
jgi:putative tryptophan/tyrosine transport system substrate-binding protein